MSILEHPPREVPPTPLMRGLFTFIAGNYFYVISAILMMLGCYLVMVSPAIAGGAFGKTVSALVLLQAYELLILATAAYIVRRLLRLSDAFTLLLIELALLLDPTFFTNAVYTLVISGDNPFPPPAVNLIVLALVPVKLVLLQRWLRFDLSGRMWLGFMAAAAYIYLGEGPLSFNPDRIARARYYFGMAWTIFGLALLIPTRTQAVTWRAGGTEHFTTPRQREGLGTALLILPVAVCVAHFIESAFVHNIEWPVELAAPLLAAVALLVATQSAREANLSVRLGVIDALLTVAFVLTLHAVSPQRRAEGSMIVPGWLTLGAIGLAAAVVYLIFWRRLHSRAALRRLIGLIIAAVIGGLFYLNVITPALRAIGELIGALFTSLGEHPRVLWTAGWLALVAFAYFIKAGWYRYMLGLATLILVQVYLHGTDWSLGWELAQAALWWTFYCVGRMDDPDTRKTRHVYACIAALIAVGNYRYEPTWLHAGVLGAELVAIAALAWRARSAILALFVLGILAFLAQRYYQEVELTGAVPVIVLGSALALFGVAVWVTFKKEAILAFLESSNAQPLGPTLQKEDTTPPLDATMLRRSQRNEGVKGAGGQTKAATTGEAAGPGVVDAGGDTHTETWDEAVERQYAQERVRMMVQSLFFDSRLDSITLLSQADAGRREYWRKMLDTEDEPIVLVHPRGMFDQVVLTLGTTCVEQWNPGARLPVFRARYEQIASVARTFGSIILTSHAGQTQSMGGMTGNQARYVKQALELMMEELAMEHEWGDGEE